MLKLLSKVNLGDRYEIQTRVLPAMVGLIPVIALVLQFEYAHKNWLRALGIGGGLDVFLALVFSKLAHALGRQLEDRLVKQWGGLPTHRWLRPDDPTHSAQQKAHWRKALQQLSGIDLDAVIAAGDPAEIDRAIGDAVLNARNAIRGRREAALLHTHNIAYGFARNLAGMRTLTLLLSIGAFTVGAICWYGGQITLSGLLLQGLFVVAALVYQMYGVGYVRHSADRYAEFFFAVITKIAYGTRRTR